MIVRHGNHLIAMPEGILRGIYRCSVCGEEISVGGLGARGSKLDGEP